MGYNEQDKECEVMLISTKGRYALRLLVDLAGHRGQGTVSLGSMAARQGLSEKYLEAILKPLVRDAILEGTRGKGGGYRMLLEPKDITLGRVLRLVEPSLGSVSCLKEGAEECPRRDECPTLPLWQELNAVIFGFLDGKTLEDLLTDERNRQI
jgi:Rrf2 family protein